MTGFRAPLDISPDPPLCAEVRAGPSNRAMPENNPTSPVSPLAVYPAPPPTEVRSRAPEFYGFVAWSSTYLLYCFFLLWALLPDTYLVWLGISWYPSRQVFIVPVNLHAQPAYPYFSVSFLRTLYCAVRRYHHTREWALLLPAYTVVLVLLTYCAYLALALSGTPSFSDVSTVTGAPCMPIVTCQSSQLTTVGTHATRFQGAPS